MNSNTTKSITVDVRRVFPMLDNENENTRPQNEGEAKSVLKFTVGCKNDVLPVLTDRLNELEGLDKEHLFDGTYKFNDIDTEGIEIIESSTGRTLYSIVMEENRD